MIINQFHPLIKIPFKFNLINQLIKIPFKYNLIKIHFKNNPLKKKHQIKILFKNNYLLEISHNHIQIVNYRKVI